MAELTLKNCMTGEEIICSEIDLNTITSHLIHQLIEAKILPYEESEYGYPLYRIIDPQGCPIIDDISLAEVGFKNGDLLRIVARGYSR